LSATLVVGKDANLPSLAKVAAIATYSTDVLVNRSLEGVDLIDYSKNDESKDTLNA